jgi:uncharacterized protein YyaL (SSP411 family)
MINSLLIGRLNAICPSRRVDARRSLAVIIFVCVELLSSFAADPKSSTEYESQYTNHLINEKSPYLLQHAHNPVDWYPWGEEAFATARKENKPIFLSVGYSTCHWCHVMERESYCDPEIAKIMNANFVSVKVDREERPDIDNIYMTFVQATTGNGGWPMNVWLTPDLKPFVGGTYFSAKDSNGKPVFKNVLLQVADAWKRRRDEIVASSKEITSQLQKFVQSSNSSGHKVSREILQKAYNELAQSFDSEYGGFGGAPKFPRPVVLNLLLHTYAASPDSPEGKHALEMTLFTLRKIAEGGIHDHLGGGFHRYSVDALWHVPHFEKMLYDQGQLASAYLDAYQITRDSFFATTARDILDYVQRDMTGPEGGFYSAEDADSLVQAGKPDHREGAFYVWTKDEVDHALGPDRAKVFDYVYGVEAKGNAADSDTSGELAGKNILIERHSVEDAAKEFNSNEDQVRQLLDENRKLLLQARNQRPRPSRDDKVVTSSNGLLISAFARGAQVLNEPRYLKTARQAADFVQTNLYRQNDHTLLHTYREGESKIDGFTDDYAFLIQGLVDLYEASFETHWLDLATALQDTQNELFWDTKGDAYFTTTGKDPNLFLRSKGDFDGAEPSANSISALNLVRLSWFFDNKDWHRMAEQTINAFQVQLSRSPSSLSQMLVALDASESAPRQIVVAGKPDASDTLALLREVNNRYQPNEILILADGGLGQTYFAQKIEFFKDVHPIGDKATAYVCQNFVCQLPTNDRAVVSSLLDTGKPPPTDNRAKQDAGKRRRE